MAGGVIIRVLLMYTVAAVIQLSSGQQIYLSLGSTTITTNNTEIRIVDIGENTTTTTGTLPALNCNTAEFQCCRGSDSPLGIGGVGEWYYPDGRAVHNYPDSIVAGETFFRGRGPQVVRLARRESGYLLSPTGSYCCVIPTRYDYNYSVPEIEEMTFCANLVVCLSLPSLTNGTISYNDSALGLGTRAIHSCDTGYRLIGDITRICRSGGSWSGSAPYCQATCPSLATIRNGQLTYSSSQQPIVENTVATYSCNQGYILIGEGTLTCQSDTAWSSTAPYCAATCPSLPAVSNGQLAYSSLRRPIVENTVAIYSCKKGYILIGEGTLTCQSDTAWSSTAPYCAATCPSLPAVSNGRLAYSSLRRPIVENTVATYSCNQGYTLMGESTLTCQSDRTWSSTAPYCTAICPSLPNLRNGVITYNSSFNTTYLEGTVANYSCDIRYVLIGESTLTCLSDRTWSSAAPYCIDQAVIQLKFGPTSHCLQWNQYKATTVSNHLRQAIHNVILRGKEAIPLVNIDEGVFSCHSSPDHPTFRTTINGTREASAVSAAVDIQKWVESGAVVKVEWYLVTINRNCPVHITSVSEQECGEDECVESCVAVCNARRG